MSTAVAFLPGAQVGAKRWPLSACHPSIWAKPRKGTVLDVRDRKAWATAIGAPLTAPDIEQRVAILASTHLPVHWDFGDIFWEPVQSLMPYATDLANWTVAQAKAEQALRRPANHHQALAA